MNQVFVCSTFYHVYVSMLISAHEKRGRDFMLIVNDLTPEISESLDRIRATFFFDHVLYVPFRETEKHIRKRMKWQWAFNRSRVGLSFINANSNLPDYHKFIEKSEINIFPDIGLTAAYFIHQFPKSYFRMVEEGEGAYHLRISKSKAFKRKYVLRTFLGGGLDNEIKEIMVQHPENLDLRVKQKGVKLELEKMVKSLDEENRNRILSYFLNGLKFEFGSKAKLLLITQPLEESYMTEAEKVKLYNQIVDHFGPAFQIFVKPHPRERTEYTGRLNSSITVVSKGFPLEMFDLLGGFKFEMGVTICSSALYNLACVDRKIIFGREYLTKPLPPNWPALFEC